MMPGAISNLARVRFPPSGTAPGNVDGPSSSTANALVRFNGTTGKIIQNGVVTEADLTGTLTGPASQTTTTAVGIAYTNQPSNDSVTIVSNSASDVQTATVIGTTTGGNTTVTEAIVLTGTTPVVTVKVNWGKILAIKLSGAAVGTITIKKTTGGTTITTLTATATSSGVSAVSNTAAYNRVVSVVASGATTKQLGLGGTNSSNAQIYDSVVLTGTTAVPSNSAFNTLTEIYIGDVENSVTVTETSDSTWILTGGSGVAFNTSSTLSLTVSGGAAAVLTGGAGNMTILSGTGASRLMIFQTTTSGSAATTALTLQADQSATFAGKVRVAAGTAASTGLIFNSGNANSGLYYAGTNGVGVGTNGVNAISWDANQQMTLGANLVTGATTDTKLVKAIASIANNTATDVLTVTIPNAAHSASLRVSLTGSLGAGGAIGANEATGTIIYNLSITRTAGVATVTTVSTGYGSATSSVAGAATITVTGAATAMSGVVGATQTFTFQTTIARGSGSSANHTCVVLAELVNANTAGISIA